MKKIISCINKKGGCGKTTSLMALADGLAIRGEKILVVDLDSQMNMSMAYGDFHLAKTSIYNVLCEKDFNIYDAIYPVPEKYFEGVEVAGKVDILPANSYVDRLQEELNAKMRKEERLLRCLQKLNASDYDYILIDTAPLPVTDIVITNVMAASDEILVATKLEPFSSTGVELVYPRINQLIEEELNPELKINGILCTQVTTNRRITNTQIYNDIKNYAEKRNIYVYENYIRNLADVATKQIARQTIYKPTVFEKTRIKKNGEEVVTKLKRKTQLAKDYENFVKEFIERG